MSWYLRVGKHWNPLSVSSRTIFGSEWDILYDHVRIPLVEVRL